MLLALFVVAYQILGPMPWKDKESRRVNSRLEFFLEKGIEVDLSTVYEIQSDDAYFLIIPPYYSINKDSCSLPSYASNPHILETRPALHDGLSRMVVFTQSRVLMIATVYGRELFCGWSELLLCSKVNDTILSVDMSASKPCFKIIRKEN